MVRQVNTYVSRDLALQIRCQVLSLTWRYQVFVYVQRALADTWVLLLRLMFIQIR